jgi:hypothetical protein
LQRPLTATLESQELADGYRSYFHVIDTQKQSPFARPIKIVG